MSNSHLSDLNSTASQVQWMMNVWGFRKPPDTGFEIKAVVVSYRTRYLAVTEVSHNTKWMSGGEIFVSSKPEYQSGG